MINKVLGILALVFLLSACSEEGFFTTNPQNEIVIIGNGMTGMVVADVKKEEAITSFVLQKNKVEPLMESLKVDESQGEAPKKKEAKLDWIAKDNLGNQVIKLSNLVREGDASLSSERATESPLEEILDENTCKYLKNFRNGRVVCLHDYKDLEISSNQKPHFFSDASFLYLDDKNALYLKLVNTDQPQLLQVDVKELHSSLNDQAYIKTAQGDWNYIQYKADEDPAIFSLGEFEVSYVGGLGDLFVFGTEKDELLEAGSFYRFNSKKLDFELIWKKSIEAELIEYELSTAGVSRDELYFPGTTRGAFGHELQGVARLSPRGLKLIPFFQKPVGFSLGRDKFIVELMESGSVIRKVCPTDGQVPCEDLVDPEGYKVAAALMGHSDEIYLGAQKIIENQESLILDEPEELIVSYDIIKLKLDAKVWQTTDTWPLLGEIEKLRFYTEAFQ
jgi:hypothetical protein